MAENAVPDPARRHDGPSVAPDLVAALDLGTSNCRMMIAAPHGRGFRVVDSLSRIVGLGEGLPSSGVLSDAAMARAGVALAECADRFARRGVVTIDAVATEACRRAANGGAFLSRARAETGLAIRTISTREEAALTVESCAALLSGACRRALVFDIGGGSTEISWVRVGGETLVLSGTVSLPFGVVTIEDELGADADTEEGFERIVCHAAAAVAPFEQVHRIAHEIRLGGVRLIGTSGTVTTLAGEALGLTRYRRPLVDGVTLELAAARAASGRLRALGREGLVSHPCVGPERAKLVLAGCAIFEAIRRQWPVDDILVADRGLREGLLLRLLRARPADPSPARPRGGPVARAAAAPP